MGRLFGDEGQVESRVDFTAEFLSFVEVNHEVGTKFINSLLLSAIQTDSYLFSLACAERTKLTLTPTD
jgi:hypothetical protein